jgi:hypothetical protein
MRLMGDIWLGLLGFRGAVLAQDRCIGFQDRSGNTHPGASLALSREGCCLLGKKLLRMFWKSAFLQKRRFLCINNPEGITPARHNAVGA